MYISAADLSSWLRIGRTVVVGAVVALVAATSCFAELQYYEPFLIGNDPAAGEYTVGLIDPTDAAGDGQNPIVGPDPFLAGPWERAASAPNGAIQETGLSYLGSLSAGGAQLATPVIAPGNTLSNSRQRRYLPSPWSSATNGTFYMGFQVNFGQGFYEDQIEGNDMGYRAVEFWQDGGGFAMGIAYNSFGSLIDTSQTDPRTGRMYADWSELNGSHEIIANSPPSFISDGTTHLVVLRFDLSDQPASDSVFIYFDPVSAVQPDLPGASISGIDFTLGALSGVSIFGGSGTFPVYDELRVATTFVEAIPELPRPGDTNGDGEVDLLDYMAIMTHFNLTGQTTANGDVAGADGKQGTDGRVDLRDFGLWRDNRTDLTSTGSGGLALPVPEPATITLLVIAAIVPAANWLRRRRV